LDNIVDSLVQESLPFLTPTPETNEARCKLAHRIVFEYHVIIDNQPAKFQFQSWEWLKSIEAPNLPRRQGGSVAGGTQNNG